MDRLKDAFQRLEQDSNDDCLWYDRSTFKKWNGHHKARLYVHDTDDDYISVSAFPGELHQYCSEMEIDIEGEDYEGRRYYYARQTDSGDIIAIVDGGEALGV